MVKGYSGLGKRSFVFISGLLQGSCMLNSSSLELAKESVLKSSKMSSLEHDDLSKNEHNQIFRPKFYTKARKLQLFSLA